MSKAVSNGAMIKCSFAQPPGTTTLQVQPLDQINAENQPMATTMDYIPMKNIGTFGMCTAPSNPQVVAAQGSPVPCMPVIVAPWIPGSPTVMLGGKPALNKDSKCMCTWAGVIKIENPGPTKTEVP